MKRSPQLAFYSIIPSLKLSFHSHPDLELPARHSRTRKGPGAHPRFGPLFSIQSTLTSHGIPKPNTCYFCEVINVNGMCRPFTMCCGSMITSNVFKEPTVSHTGSTASSCDCPNISSLEFLIFVVGTFAIFLITALRPPRHVRGEHPE